MKRFAFVVALVAIMTGSFQVSAQPRGHQQHGGKHPQHMEQMRPGRHQPAPAVRPAPRPRPMVAPRFLEQRRFFNGLAAVRDINGWTFINSLGQRVTGYFYAVYDFADGRALVQDRYGWHYIDIYGNRISNYSVRPVAFAPISINIRF